MPKGVMENGFPGIPRRQRSVPYPFRNNGGEAPAYFIPFALDPYFRFTLHAV
jgi:hypothetical protein